MLTFQASPMLNTLGLEEDFDSGFRERDPQVLYHSFIEI
jgi:hypothetical protein